MANRATAWYNRISVQCPQYGSEIAEALAVGVTAFERHCSRVEALSQIDRLVRSGTLSRSARGVISVVPIKGVPRKRRPKPIDKRQEEMWPR